jgi:very-short-patch-repair endonuclease
MAERVVKGSKTSASKLVVSRAFRRSPTPAERKLWRELHGNRLAGFHFRRQQIIEGFIADFYCHAAALVIEVDGEIHEQQQEYDNNRSLVFAARGIRVLRFSNDEVLHNLSRVVTRIFAAAEREDELASSSDGA